MRICVVERLVLLTHGHDAWSPIAFPAADLSNYADADRGHGHEIAEDAAGLLWLAGQVLSGRPRRAPRDRGPRMRALGPSNILGHRASLRPLLCSHAPPPVWLASRSHTVYLANRLRQEVSLRKWVGALVRLRLPVAKGERLGQRPRRPRPSTASLSSAAVLRLWFGNCPLGHVHRHTAGFLRTGLPRVAYVRAGRPLGVSYSLSTG